MHIFSSTTALHTTRTVILSVLMLAVSTGCTPTISDKYVATALDGTGKTPGRSVEIKLDPNIDITVRGECFPTIYPCRVVISWYHDPNDMVEFSDGKFVARDIHNHDIVYGSTHAGLAKMTWRKKGGPDGQYGKGTGVHLVDPPPKEFHLVMPKLIVNGVEKDVPVVHFKLVRGLYLTPIITNY